MRSEISFLFNFANQCLSVRIQYSDACQNAADNSQNRNDQRIVGLVLFSVENMNRLDLVFEQNSLWIVLVGHMVSGMQGIGVELLLAGDLIVDLVFDRKQIYVVQEHRRRISSVISVIVGGDLEPLVGEKLLHGFRIRIFYSVLRVRVPVRTKLQVVQLIIKFQRLGNLVVSSYQVPVVFAVDSADLDQPWNFLQVEVRNQFASLLLLNFRDQSLDIEVLLLDGFIIYVHRLIGEASQLVHPILEIQSLVVHIINNIK